MFTNTQRSFLVDETLESLESKLNPQHFFRINRKFYVHINAIKDMVSYTNSRLQIFLNHFHQEDIIVSREKVKSFKNWLH